MVRNGALQVDLNHKKKKEIVYCNWNVATFFPTVLIEVGQTLQFLNFPSRI